MSRKRRRDEDVLVEGRSEDERQLLVKQMIKEVDASFHIAEEDCIICAKEIGNVPSTYKCTYAPDLHQMCATCSAIVYLNPIRPKQCPMCREVMRDVSLYDVFRNIMHKIIFLASDIDRKNRKYKISEIQNWTRVYDRLMSTLFLQFELLEIGVRNDKRSDFYRTLREIGNINDVYKRLLDFLNANFLFGIVQLQPFDYDRISFLTKGIRISYLSPLMRTYQIIFDKKMKDMYDSYRDETKLDAYHSDYYNVDELKRYGLFP